MGRVKADRDIALYEAAMGKVRAGRPYRGIAFYMEALALLAVFAAVVVVLVRGFSSAGRMSREAADLSCAVHLAENAAEMASASKSGDMLFSMLNENGNARAIEGTGDASRSVYSARYDEDMMPASDGIFRVDISWEPGEGGMAKSEIAVYRDSMAEPVYALELGIYIGNGG